MILTKEILTAMKKAENITFIKRDDGITYMICCIKMETLNTEITKEYVIDSNIQSNRFYTTLYTWDRPIKTVIGHLKVDDEIKINVTHQKCDESLTIINVHIDVKRGEKYRTYIIESSTAKYLHQ